MQAKTKGFNVKLTEQEKKKIIELIEAGKTLPAVYKSKLFMTIGLTHH